MKAGILTIGDELLIGQVINTNTAWLGQRLNAIGFEVHSQVTVGDGMQSMLSAMEAMSFDCDLIIMTGGLGPTHDDITKHALASFAGVELEMDESVLASVAEKLRHRGREVTEGSRQIGLVPNGAEVLENPKGTAPGLWMHRQSIGAPGATSFIAVPGVPYEMKVIFDQHIAPLLSELSGLKVICQKTLLTAGTGESMLAKKLGDISEFLDAGLSLAWLPNAVTGVRIRITAKGNDQASTKRELTTFENRIRKALSDYIYGEAGDTLEEKLGSRLRERGLKVAVAESCTGGLLGDRLTRYAGSSDFFQGGVITYSNLAKVEMLDVDEHVLNRKGAVSGEVAKMMAESVRQKFGADIGLSTTGVAGPGGGSLDKPVGTVYTAIASEGVTDVKKLSLTRDRDINRTLATTYLLFRTFRSLEEVK